VITDPTTPHERRTKARSLLGFRRQPGKLALLVFRLPLPLYRAGWGWLFLGRAFLVVTHVGRRTGEQHATAAMVLAEDETTGEAVICSVWGQRTDWIRNLHAHPTTRVQIEGTRSYRSSGSSPSRRHLPSAWTSGGVTPGGSD
jgi:deazaflavin-dependent oxidoreductase (nitroreductase family)